MREGARQRRVEDHNAAEFACSLLGVNSILLQLVTCSGFCRRPSAINLSMRSRLTLSGGFVAAGSLPNVFDLDELSGRNTGSLGTVTVGGTGSTVYFHETRMVSHHLRFDWIPRASTWNLTNGGPEGTVFTNDVPLGSGEMRPLLLSSCKINCAGVELLFERTPAPPLFNDEYEREVPISEEGLLIGRGPGKGDDDAPRLCLDDEVHTISALQAQILPEGNALYLINHHQNLRFRTKVNGNQGFERHRLVYGDCIQIPDYDYYTFQFNGRSLVHIGHSALIQARGLNRVEGGRRILAQVDLDLSCGEFVGVLGGSGQGKSTLMKALCGIQPAPVGEVWLEGRCIASPADMAAAGIGYVPQEDIVHRELTVRDALRFAVQLRVALPNAQIDEAIQGVLSFLALTEHQHKPVRVLSGGQCKRVSIASELVMNPRFLFLDEPTSGLDPLTESDLMSELSLMARTKRMGILCTTHVLQNSHLFTGITIVQGGRVIYYGKPVDAVRHFLIGGSNSGRAATSSSRSSRSSSQSSGLSAMMTTAPEQSSTPELREDELLAMMSKVYREVDRKARQLTSEIESQRESQDEPATERVQEQVAREMEDEYKTSRFFVPLRDIQKPESGDEVPPIKKRRPGFFRTLGILNLRQWKILLSDPLNYLFLLAQALVIGVLVGWVSENLVFQMFLTVIATLWFGCSNGAQQIVSELPVFRRERLAGVGLHAYIWSKVLFYTGITSIQAIILYFMVLLTHHLTHPEMLPTAENRDPKAEMEVYSEIFFLNVPALMKPPASDTSSAVAKAPVADDFDVVDAEDYKPDTSAPTFQYRNPTRLRAFDPEFRAMIQVASFFRVRENLMDQLGVQRVEVRPGQLFDEGRKQSWPIFLAQLLGLRFGALLAASLCGVAIGLVVSASVRSVTQAVMWVPLILIPQILFGGFVVTVPEMSAPVRWLASILPSYNLHRLMDVANIYGRHTPSMTNKTKIPAFLASPPYEEESVRFTDEHGVQTEKYDKLSDVSKSWQNLIVRTSRVGKRIKEKDEDSVEYRRDVLFPKGIPYSFTAAAGTAWSILGGWVLFSYLAVFISLNKKDHGR